MTDKDSSCFENDLGHDVGSIMISELMDYLFADVATTIEPNHVMKLSNLADEEFFRSLSVSLKALHKYKAALTELYLGGEGREELVRELNGELSAQLQAIVERRFVLPQPPMEVSADSESFMLKVVSDALEKVISESDTITNINSNTQSQVQALISLYDSLPFH